MIRIASLPDPKGQTNPYLRLLYNPNESGQFEIVSCPGIRFRWLLANAQIIDVLHLHWPSFLYASENSFTRCKRLLTVLLFLKTAQALGIQVVWTMHNVLPHQRYPGNIDCVARRLLLNSVNLLLFHEPEHANEAQKLFRFKQPYDIVPHMAYLDTYPNAKSSSNLRETFHIPQDACVFLHFGSIRPNKNVPWVIDTFRRAAKDGKHLVIAGAPLTPELELQIRETASQDPHITLHLANIKDEEIADLHKMADFAVVASQITTSGSMHLHLSYGVPVITHHSNLSACLAALPCCIAYDDQHTTLQYIFGSINNRDLDIRRKAANDFAASVHPNIISKRLYDCLRTNLKLCKL